VSATCGYVEASLSDGSLQPGFDCHGNVCFASGATQGHESHTRLLNGAILTVSIDDGSSYMPGDGVRPSLPLTAQDDKFDDIPRDAKGPTALQVKFLEAMFLFSLIWGLGGLSFFSQSCVIQLVHMVLLP
jgi:hypothetical protein